MKRAFICPRIFVMGILCGVTLTGRADLLDFNSPPPAFGAESFGHGQSYVEDGFRFQTVSDGSIIRWDPLRLPGVLPNNGTPYFGATQYSKPRMDRLDGGLFSISQIDLSEYSRIAEQFPGLTVHGNKGNGGSVAITFALPSWNGTFATFYFGPEWINLQSVDFFEAADFLTPSFAWDNIVATGAIPEPTIWSLLTLGAVTLFGGLRLRRRSP